MIINHNIAAMNTNRYLNNNNNATSKSLEKLSSGLKINRAGDDAAGLAISEKMRAQIRGLDKATENAQNGVSLIQTAEGSLQTIENILQRMRELAVQSSTDTNVNLDDREAIQLEIDALVSEVDRIAEQSEFNTQALLDGTFKGKYFHIGANTYQNIQVSIDKMDTDALGLNKKYSGFISGYANMDVLSGYKIAFDDYSAVGTTYSAAIKAAMKYLWSASHKTDTAVTSAVYTSVQAAQDALAQTMQTVTRVSTGTKAGGAVNTVVPIMVASTGGSLSLSTQARANDAIKTINDSINIVSRQRAELGAIQNRLEYAIENLEVSSENTSASEANIRDVNMANEMMNFTKNNILSQAATAMLAQANQTPQNVLSLLR